MKTTLLKYGGRTRENFQEPLAISVFVERCSPDINKYFKKHMPGWQGETLTKILSIAAFVFDGRDEEKQEREKERNKQERMQEQQEREREISLLAAAITQNYQSRGRGRGISRGTPRGRGRGGRAPVLSSLNQSNPNTLECFCCGNIGHIQRERSLCPVSAARGSNPPYPPRPRSQ